MDVSEITLKLLDKTPYGRIEYTVPDKACIGYKISKDNIQLYKLYNTLAKMGCIFHIGMSQEIQK